MNCARPNLFRFATSELSQDAFLCWLLSWADPQYQSQDSNLHTVSMDFLKLIFDKSGHQIPASISTLVVKKQVSNIDILCEINESIAVVIEDKVGTCEHSEQLARYKNKMIEEGFVNARLVLVYIQTGDQSSYAAVHQQGYCVISRSALLEVLESPHAYQARERSDVLDGFACQLRKIEDDVNSYQHKPLDSWNGNTWKGFYMRLQKELGLGGWGYVPNQSGGFWGFWGASQGDDNCERYLQLEEDRLCLKICVSDAKQRRKLRQFWSDKLIKASKGHQALVHLQKPTKFGHGEHMAVAVLEDYRQADTHCKLDMGKTVDGLRQAIDLLVN